MTEYIGNIAVPEIAPSGIFPIASDYGYGIAYQPQVAVHRFGAGNAKIEQRYLLGDGAKRFIVRKARIKESEREALRDFWEARKGGYGSFTYNAPNLGEGLSLVANGAFDSATGWTISGSGVAISGGKCNWTASAGGLPKQNVGILAGRTYRVTFTVSEVAGGGFITPAIYKSSAPGYEAVGAQRSANGTYTDTFTAPSDPTGELYFYGENTVSLDDAILVDITPTIPYMVRFENAPLSWEMLTDEICSIGITLVEIPATSPAYTVNSTVTRFPSATLETALLSQVQQIVPLVKIQPRASGYPAIYVSDRRCTVGGQLYQARLIDWDGISQSLGNESDQAQFNFGNADRVMRGLVNDTDLNRASIEFSLFHVGTGIKLDLWKGEIDHWELDAGPVFRVTASDGIYELTLPYPTRKISRSCWKIYNDGNACPYATQGSLDLTNFPNASAASCDKSYDGANGCLAHSMKRYFGGLIAEPQGVRIKDNSQGTWGFGRPTITSTSIVADSVYDQVIPEIYTDNESFVDKDGVTQTGMPVNAKIAGGREEGDFYEALGIVSEGPLTLHTDYAKYTLDGQKNHGYPGADGLRLVNGADPAGAQDWCSLDEISDTTGGDFRKVILNGRRYKDNFAAGLAFVVIRRGDEKGVQLSYPTDHQMVANVLNGLQGWVWTAAGARTAQVLTNPVWIAVNMMLRARGLRFSTAATAEQYFDVDAAIAAAAICDTSVNKIIGTGTETQFKFRGILSAEKPLRDWITEVLMNCVGYFTFAFGKLKIGIRSNSSVVEAFTAGNILLDSLRLSPNRPAFNHLTAAFADREFDFAANSVTLYDIDHAKLVGGATAPLFLKSTMNLSGACTKSHAARVLTTRLREELGGITAAQWTAARAINFRTTVLALKAEAGMVCSMTHDDMPGGAGEFRVIGWRLNKDYSIDIGGRTTVDEMYDMTVGPKPADVLADAVPVEILPDKDTGNPSGASALEAIVEADEATIPRFHAAFQLNAETVNNNNMLGLCVYLHPTQTGEGPYSAERTAHPACVIETGSCYVTAGRRRVVCASRASDPAVVSRLFVIYTADASPDSDLAAEIIESQGAGFVTLLEPFVRSGVYSYAIIKRFWDIGGADSTNTFYRWVPVSEIGSGKQAVWRTPPLELPKGTFYVTAWTRNRFGMGTRLTAGPITITWSGNVTDDTDNPSGCANLVILLQGDDPQVGLNQMAFKFDRDLYNYQSIFAVEIALRFFTGWTPSVARSLDDVICNLGGTMTFRCSQAGTSGTAEPTWNATMGGETTDGTAKWRRVIPPAAHGPYALQRATYPADVLASGSGIACVAGAINITLNMPTPPADGTFADKVLLLFLSDLVTAKWTPSHAYLVGDQIVDTNNNIQECTTAGTSGVAEPTWAQGIGVTTADGTAVFTNGGGADLGLDGNIIQTQVGNLVTIYSVQRFVRTATMNWAVTEQWWNLNNWERTFRVPDDFVGGDLASKVWKTLPVIIWPEKVVAADVYSRNIFGLSQ